MCALVLGVSSELYECARVFEWGRIQKGLELWSPAVPSSWRFQHVSRKAEIRRRFP